MDPRLRSRACEGCGREGGLHARRLLRHALVSLLPRHGGVAVQVRRVQGVVCGQPRAGGALRSIPDGRQRWRLAAVDVCARHRTHREHGHGDGGLLPFTPFAARRRSRRRAHPRNDGAVFADGMACAGIDGRTSEQPDGSPDRPGRQGHWTLPRLARPEQDLRP